MGDRFDFNLDAHRQILHCKAAAGRAIFLEIVFVDRIELGKIADLRQITGGLEHRLQAATSGLQYMLEVLQ
ncbi:hypothetical protein D3C71_2208450 [compost metagenome]